MRSLLPTLCASWLREPTDTVARSGVLCRHAGFALVHPRVQCGRELLAQARQPTGQGRQHRAPVKERSARRPRTPSIVFALPCGRVSCLLRLFLPSLRQPKHPFRHLHPARLVKDLGLRERLAPQGPHERRLIGARGLRGEMPSYDLCNRLDVTSTHQSSDSRAERLRAADLRFTHRPVTRALARAGHGAIHVDAEFPLLEISDPRWSCGWAPQHQLRARASSRMRPAANMSLPADPRRRIRPRASRMNDLADAPCRNASVVQARAGDATKNPSSHGAPTPHGCESGTPSFDVSPSCICLPEGRPHSQSRHCCSDLAAGAQLPTRVHAYAVRARSRCGWLFAARARGHVRLIDFCNRNGP